MKQYCYFQLVLLLSLFFTGCDGQTSQQKNSVPANTVGGPFENNDFTYVGMPDNLTATDTSSGWNGEGQKILLTGTIYQNDGRTPAPGVLLYYYHTNTSGRYIHLPDDKRSMPPNEYGQTHGYLRGWVKTNSEGKYYIYTVKPGSYPTGDEPAHIHATVKENNINEYYIDDYLFDDDKLLTSAKRKRLDNRGGSGILRMAHKGDMMIGERNIILGLKIPDYPVASTSGLKSGRNIGEEVISFIPYHAWGPDKGSRTCPVCKYGWYHGILYFVGNNPDWNEIKQWLTFLESESRKRSEHLKAYFIYGNEKSYDKNKREQELVKIGKELQLEKVALTYVPSFDDNASEIDLNLINPETSTIIVYKRSIIVDKYINLSPLPENFKLINDRLNATNEYLDLPQPRHD